MKKKPWDLHPALTEPRLCTIAGFIAAVRKDAVDRFYQPTRGDTPWSLGCVAYERIRYAIAKAATDPRYNGWLSVADDDGLKFVFTIGGVPIRMYRGDPDHKAPGRATRVHEAEALAQQITMWPDDVVGDRSIRLVVEVDLFQYVSAVTMVQVDDEGQTFHPWRIPLDGQAVVIPFDTKEEPIEIDKPVVKPRGSTEQEMDERTAEKGA